MKQALYAGSFDPWTFGHQYVLNAALEVFQCVHVVSAINLAKQSMLKPDIRARIIAHSINPFNDWWSQDPPFKIGNGVVVASHEGLIADYAKEHGITHFIRGLRSTTDFEAEFNLYFSNQAINQNLQTWAIMCPPQLLHCSSTYVKTVVGKPHVKFVGTNFISQSLMLGWVRIVGQIFDLIDVCSKHRFDNEPLNLSAGDISESLQVLFSAIFQKVFRISRVSVQKTHKILELFLKNQGETLKEKVFGQHEFPEEEINTLWAILCFCLDQNVALPSNVDNVVQYLFSFSGHLGKTSVVLFSQQDVLKSYLNLRK